jgi:hypothetical protein
VRHSKTTQMQISIKEILTIYWSQTVLIIAGFGYLIKRIFDLRTKKIEIKQNLFQQNRMNVIMRFMESYIKLQQFYRQICQPEFNLKEQTTQVFHESLSRILEELYASFFYLRLFLDPLEQARYSDLMNEMRNISTTIKESAKKTPENAPLRSEVDVKDFIDGKLRVNNENFKIISEIFRENSNKHYAIKI